MRITLYAKLKFNLFERKKCMLKKITFFIAMGLLVGCAQQGFKIANCATTDWERLGMGDGAQGHLIEETFNHYKQQCKAEKVKVDFVAYKKGYKEGLKSFCNYHNGYKQGLKNREYHDNCASLPELEQEFLSGIAAGVKEATRIRMEQQNVRLEPDRQLF